MRLATAVLALGVSLVIVGNLWAAEEKTRPERARPLGFMMFERLESIKGLNLTDQQKGKIDALKKEYGSKLKEGQAKMDGILTAEQKKARDEAIKAAEVSGKRGREVWEGVQSAMKLTDEQKAKIAETRKEIGPLRREVHEKVMAILTPEQKELWQKDRPGMREPRPVQEQTSKPTGRNSGMLRGLNLTEDQQAKVKKIREEYGPKLKEAQGGSLALRKEMHEKILAILTPEQAEQLKKSWEQPRGQHGHRGPPQQ
jgi:Spy/CpxP family protein refolding chaperone